MEGPNAYQAALLSLYQKSLLKKAKYAAIQSLLPPVQGKHCLDIGADNGVISYLLRTQGGEWTSADLDESVLDSIRKMVGDRVVRFDGGRTEFADHTFDIVVIIDFLEHIPQDRAFLQELSRIIKPGGTLLINVPHYRKGSWIRRLRLATGLTDEKHGHLRPGYNLESLKAVCEPEFAVEQDKTYSRFFVELYDVFVSLVFERLSGQEETDEAGKGVVVTGDDLARHKKKFKLFSLIYPVVWTLAQLDKLLFWTEGHSLIVRATNSTKPD